MQIFNQQDIVDMLELDLTSPGHSRWKQMPQN